MRRFLSPGWIVGHVVILLAAVVMVRLGMWQLERLQQVRERNATIEQRLSAPPLRVAGAEVLGLDPDALEYRRVVVTGTYRPEQEVLRRNRARAGVNGFHVLTPLAVGGGASVLVDRGWVPAELDEPGDLRAAPPAREVTVEGVLRRSGRQPGFGARDPEDGRLARVFHVDLPRLQDQVDGRLAPMWIQALFPDDATALPRATEPPDTSEGNHLSYAVQWFSFAAIAVVGYGAFLRTRAREQDDDDTVDGSGLAVP